MEGLDTLLLLRGMERIVIATGGIVALLLGALLFRWGVSGSASLKARREETELQLINASPGIFFALFGAVILVWGLANPFSYDLPPRQGADSSATAAAGPPATESPGGRVVYGDEVDRLEGLIEDLLRLDPSQSERLAAQVEYLQARARELRQGLADAEGR